MGPLFFKEGDGQHLMLHMNADEMKNLKEKMPAEGWDGKDMQIRRRLASPREAELREAAQGAGEADRRAGKAAQEAVGRM